MSTTRSVLAALLLTTALPLTLAHAQTPAASPATPAAAVPAEQLLKAGELDQLVAPIALYPDTLLAEVLMASTYPLEVVQADRWATANKALKADQLKAAVDKQGWDASVKALVATPTVLAMMSEKLDWTQKLGDAVLAQQPDVMDAVQRLRTRAQANNKLASTKEQKVTVRQEQSKQVIVIEPAVPDTIYVPYYEPAVVYGDWAYPEYPPYYFAPPVGYLPGAVLATGIAFGAGFALGRWTSGGNYWGGGVNWGGGNINVNRPVNINNINVGSGNNWQHNSEHRHGVKYNNAGVQQKFGGSNARGGGGQSGDFRGRSGDQVIKPGGGDRAGAGTADRTPGGRTDAGNRQAAGGKDAKAGAKGSAAKGAAAKGATSKGPAGGGGPKRDSAMNVQSGRTASAQAARGRESLGGGGGGPRVSAGGGAGMGGGAAFSGGGRGGGGGFSGGGGGRGGGGGGGRRSDISVKHDIALLGWLANGIGFYRYSYNGSNTAYVGVIAQEVQLVRPDAVARGRDGYLRVFYDRLGLTFETYRHWVASGARIPSVAGSMPAQQQNW